ncbi:MAG: hypothetical protein IVW54_14540 [Candidatus Binataceae bacterium]|nr:hypothetical protein [Candidatus Binataceae bacterium]
MSRRSDEIEEDFGGGDVNNGPAAALERRLAVRRMVQRSILAVIAVMIVGVIYLRVRTVIRAEHALHRQYVLHGKSRPVRFSDFNKLGSHGVVIEPSLTEVPAPEPARVSTSTTRSASLH